MFKWKVTYANTAWHSSTLIVLAETAEEAMQNVNDRHHSNKAESAIKVN